MYVLIFQGRDDLRQDAVMQQVFGLVNSLLKKDADCSKCKLKIRSYKVSSLSMKIHYAWMIFTQLLNT